MNKKLEKGLSWRGVPLFSIIDPENWPKLSRMTSLRTFNFISEKFVDSENLILMGFDSNNIVMHEKFNWSNIAATIGLFSSAGAAKKAGWQIPIEDGYSEAFFSKSDGTPLFVFILK